MKFKKEIFIQGQSISEDSPTFVIAEAGVNHCGNLQYAKKLIDVASDAGADAVKFQAFSTEDLILKNVEKAPYQQQNTGSKESQFDMLKKLELTNLQNKQLKEYCLKKNVIFLTTPFDEISLDKLDNLDLPAYKVASTDLTNLPFLIKIAKKGKPVFLSTGMSYLSEVQLALECINKYNQEVVLLQCTANYPVEAHDANLAVLECYKRNFDILIGYSDHTTGTGAAPFAIPMGAKVIEKHFTLDKTLGGPDHQASLSPSELTEFVKLVHKVDEYMGKRLKQPNISEILTRQSLQKCLVARRKIEQGERFTEDNIIAKRTGGQGFSPIYYYDFLNKEAPKAFQKDEVISLWMK